MELALAAAVFVLVAGLTAVAGLRLWARPKAVIERLTGPVGDTAPTPPHPSLVFRDLLKRLGAVVPTPAKEAGRLERRLLRAGYRTPGAARVVNGARVLLAVLLPGAVYLAMQTLAPGSENLPVFVLAAAVMGYAAPGAWVDWRAKRRQHRIRRGLPDALDLLVICVESGLGLDQAIMQAAKEMEIAHRDISEEFALVGVEMKAGVRRADALRHLGERSGVDELKKLVAVLIQADRFGTSVAQSLRTHADFLRVQMRQKAEEQAAKLGVKLVFPIFFCILPTLFVVTVGPMAVRILREVLPMIANM
ncbi:MAG: type II secretion system F family protein [Bryobacterales bacterium]|nr:type II secretion system F family protein [Bryobacteraceae bacterium]MDW8353564.1 type II secretion system F family protein [Bryobacterales bacterium]